MFANHRHGNTAPDDDADFSQPSLLDLPWICRGSVDLTALISTHVIEHTKRRIANGTFATIHNRTLRPSCVSSRRASEIGKNMMVSETGENI